MSILDELDELSVLTDLEKEASVASAVKNLAKTPAAKALPSVGGLTSVGKSGARFTPPASKVGPFTYAKEAPSSAVKSSRPAVDRSTMKVDSATTPTGSGELGLMGKLKYKVKSMRQSLNGNTTSARRTKAEKFEKGQVDTMKGVHKDPAVTEATPKSTAPVDRSNMEVTPAQGGKPIGETKAPETKAPETETDAPKWYKNKDTMKGIGIGAAGVAAVGVGAKVMSDRKGQDSGSRPTGYY